MLVVLECLHGSYSQGMHGDSAISSHITGELGDHLYWGNIIVGVPVVFFRADVDDNGVATGS